MKLAAGYPAVAEVLAAGEGEFYVYDLSGKEVGGPFPYFEKGWEWVERTIPEEKQQDMSVEPKRGH